MNSYEHTSREFLPLSVIRSACAGDTDAVEQVLRHYRGYIVEKVIVGGYDSDGNKDPYMIVFVYKTGFKNSVDGKNFKPLRKNSKENRSPAVLCSHASNEAESMCSDSSDDTLRSGSPFDQTPCRAAH